MWNPLRLFPMRSREQAQDEIASQRRSLWHERVERLGPRTAEPVEHRPFTPLGDATRWDPPSRPALRETTSQVTASKLAPEDLERRVRESRVVESEPASF